jgi:hypothetical protein
MWISLVENPSAASVLTAAYLGYVAHHMSMLDGLLCFLNPVGEELQRSSWNRDAIVAKVTEAQEELVNGNNSKAVQIIATSGKWILETATAIGVNLVSEIIKGAIMIP